MGGELRPRRPLNTGVGEGLGSQVQGREQERGYLLEGAQFPGGPAPLLSEPQEKPGRAMLGGALEPQLSPPKTRKCQRLGTWGSEESVPWAAVRTLLSGDWWEGGRRESPHRLVVTGLGV